MAVEADIVVQYCSYGLRGRYLTELALMRLSQPFARLFTLCS
jgi:hypothetical protein